MRILTCLFLTGLSLTNPVAAQTVPINVQGTFSASGVSSVIDNRRIGAYQFRVVYANYGFSAISLQLEQAPDNGGVPGSWAAFSGGTVVVDGTNPSTSTNAATIGVHSAAAWVRINLVTATGSGVVYYALWGANSVSVAGNTSGGSAAPSGPAGGDLSGTYPNPIVAQVNGATIPLSQGCVGTNGSGQLVNGVCSATGAAGGDLSGSYPNPTVAQVNGAAVPASATALASNGSKQLIAATYQGNGAKVQLSTGSPASGNCTKFDVNGNTVDSGGPCGGGTAALVQIAQQVLGSPVSSVTFSAIPGTYSNLKLTVVARGSASNGYDTVNMQINGDTGTNYDYQYIWGNGASVSGFQSTNQTYCFVGNISDQSNGATTPGIIDINFIGYAQTTFYKDWYDASFVYSIGVLWQLRIAGEWQSTSAITSITILSAANNFVVGSVFTLYGEL